jgi:hypothetical protein
MLYIRNRAANFSIERAATSQPLSSNFSHLMNSMYGETTGAVKALLRIEGLCVLLASLFSYSKYGSGWAIFTWCFLLPDLSFIGYVAGARIGAFTYNAAHSYIGPMMCLCMWLMLSIPASLTIALIWLAHIGFDRALGYGLKYSAGFGYTHLGRIGRAARDMSC